MGCDAATAEEWYQKYGHDALLTREEMFIFFFKMKHATAKDVTAYMSQSQATSSVVEASVKKLRIYANCVHTRRLQSAANAICFCAINAWLITRVTCQMMSRNYIVLFLTCRH